MTQTIKLRKIGVHTIGESAHDWVIVAALSLFDWIDPKADFIFFSCNKKEDKTSLRWHDSCVTMFLF